MSSTIKPFKVSIPDSELELLNAKLALARLPTNTAGAEWAEDNGVSLEFMQDTLKYWTTQYDWRAEEQKINQMPQFTATVELDEGDFGPLTVHFVHAQSEQKRDGPTRPLLFLHGWPGSFIEVQKVLGTLTAAGYDVVAPSLMGFGFSSCTQKAGFTVHHHAEVMHRLMLMLGYREYAVHGTDWGSVVGRMAAMKYPSQIKAVHITTCVVGPPPTESGQQQQYTPFEKAGLDRMKWFQETQRAYSIAQGTKTRTIGLAMHDSPLGMLAWMADKLHLWSDNTYPWTPAELITWTLLHYFPGPTTAFLIYRENGQDVLLAPGMPFVEVPTGVSAFPREVYCAPRAWAEVGHNVVFWREHRRGGHFPSWECPDLLAGDIEEFFDANWKI